LFDQLGLRDRVTHLEMDIRDASALRTAVRVAHPDFVFHLAAQSLVGRSYMSPAETFEVNVMGTINLLEALRDLSHPCTVVLATTDKVYQPGSHHHAHCETDPLGGQDPYSASKAAAEMAIAAYRHSYFSGQNGNVRLATGRSGNVLGGGDWAINRVVPDCIRSLKAGRDIPVRHPEATRPWQFVLEPLSGYLELAAQLFAAPEGTVELSGAFNFGPCRGSVYSVRDLVEEVLKYWPGQWRPDASNAFAESPHLSLATTKAASLLGWFPTYDFATAVEKTVWWYHQSAAFHRDDRAKFIELTRSQIVEYETARRNKSCAEAESA
jgi:CDP-glucose 4,6-dehydratase